MQFSEELEEDKCLDTESRSCDEGCVVLGGDAGQPGGAPETEEPAAAGREQTAAAQTGDRGEVSGL